MSLAHTVRGSLETEHWKESFQSLPIWQFSSAYRACGVITGRLPLHFIPYVEGEGFSSSTAAAAFGVLAGLNVVGLLVTGRFSDRFGRKNVLAGVYAVKKSWTALSSARFGRSPARWQQWLVHSSLALPPGE